jgi:hypothetical protein
MLWPVNLAKRSQPAHNNVIAWTAERVTLNDMLEWCDERFTE